MKILKTIIVLLVCSFKTIIAQNPVHSTIEKLEVVYRESEKTDTTLFSNDKKVVTVIVINLKDQAQVSKIHLKVIKEIDNSIMYQEDYMMTSDSVVASNGDILFLKNGNVVNITSANAFVFGLYLYEITTEDNQGILSEVFSENH